MSRIVIEKTCPNCNNVFEGPPFKMNKQVTCSRACSNTYFRSGVNNGNWSEKMYRTTCFHFHKKECIICSEYNIVEVHHYDGDHSNNDKSNLIPMCSTHHQYMHSRYRSLISAKVDEYHKNFNGYSA